MGCLLVLAREKGVAYLDGISILVASDVPEGEQACWKVSRQYSCCNNAELGGVGSVWMLYVYNGCGWQRWLNNGDACCCMCVCSWDVLPGQLLLGSSLS